MTSICGNCLTFCCNITFGFGGTNDYFRQPRRGPFKRVYKNGLTNLHHINKALTHTTRHTLSTIWLIADDLGHEGPGLVWFHAACSCEAAKFSDMSSETDCCREMTIQLRGNSSGGCSCRQHTLALPHSRHHAVPCCVGSLRYTCAIICCLLSMLICHTCGGWRSAHKHRFIWFRKRYLREIGILCI